MAAAVSKKQASRFPALLDAAAALFGSKGYHAATMRDLAAMAAVTPAAIYFHFATKQDLLQAVYEEGIRRISARVQQAAAETAGSWNQLEAAMAAHLEAILDESAYARVVIRVLPDDVPEIAPALRSMRDDYEELFRILIRQLRLPRAVDKRHMRLFLLGAMNWTPVWFSSGRDKPASLAKAMLAPFKQMRLNPGHGET
jgi:TetR/AcrR family transcriptional regulator, cholesterol catabolism regulator